MIHAHDVNALYTDIAGHTPTVAYVTEQETRALRTCSEKITDAQLIALVEQVLRDANGAYSDLTHACLMSGPGGFTGLRMAASFVNTLAWQLGIPSAAIHLSDVCFARAEQEDVLWIHSTKKNEVFVRGRGAYESLAPKAAHKNLDDPMFDGLAKGERTGELIEEHKEFFGSAGLTEAKMTDVADVLPHLVSTADYGFETLEPWYGRGG